MVGDTLVVLLDIEKEEEASDKVEREDGSTIIMGDRRLRSLRLLNQQLRIFAAVSDACLRLMNTINMQRCCCVFAKVQ